MSGLSRSQATAMRAQAAVCESVQDIINIASTAEALAVTALGGALASAGQGNLKLNQEQVQVITAARAEEQDHYDYLVAAGAKPLTTSFTLPDEAIVNDTATFLTTVIGLEEAFIAAYMAAAQEFAVLNQPDLVEVALQIGGVEAEHRAHARFYAFSAGVINEVPNNIAFEKAMFTSVSGAADALTKLGWIGGTGAALNYPGPGSIDYSGIEGRKP